MIKNLLVYLITLFGTVVLVMISMIVFFSKTAESGGFYLVVLIPIFGFLTYKLASKIIK